MCEKRKNIDQQVQSTEEMVSTAEFIIGMVWQGTTHINDAHFWVKLRGGPF